MLTVITGDAEIELSKFERDSIHCIVTSPPYGNLRLYNGAWEWKFEAIAKQIFRVLCEGGVLCWNVGDEVIDGSETYGPFRQAIYLRDVCGFNAHDTQIYQKLNFSHPEKNRYHQVFEYVFILSKGPPRAFNPLRDRPNKTAGCVGNLGVNTFTERDGSKSVRKKQVTSEYGMRHNVWLGKTRGQEEMCKKLPHPAMMPKWLARDLILSFSNPGDVVLDPFAGSGTTAQEALKIGRNAITIDTNPDYTAEIRQRCQITPGFQLV